MASLIKVTLLTSLFEGNHIDKWFDVYLGEVAQLHLFLHIIKLVTIPAISSCATSQTHVSIAYYYLVDS